MRPLEIYPVLNGWVVKAGCQMVVFTDKEAFLRDFAEYLDKPHEVENRYIAMDRSGKLAPPPPPPPRGDSEPMQTEVAGESIGSRLVNALRR